jgi:hypothetical protein
VRPWCGFDALHPPRLAPGDGGRDAHETVETLRDERPDEADG